MVYVEWLRVRKLLRTTIIVLCVVFLASLAVRIIVGRSSTYDKTVAEIGAERGTVTTHEVLPNGVNRTIMTNTKERRTVEIDDAGYAGRHVVITEPSHGARKHVTHVIVGSFSIRTLPGNAGLQTTTVDTNAPTDLSVYVAIAVFVGMILATCLGATFARENDGHLELALTKPIRRTWLALAMMGVDAAAIVAGMLLTIVAMILSQSLFQIPHVTVGADVWGIFLGGTLLAFAWFAMLNAATASMRRGYGTLVGLAWPAAILVVVMANVPLGDSLVAHAVHSFFWLIARIDPLTYAQLGHSTVASNGSHTVGIGYLVSDISLAYAALFVAYVALAIAQWQRVEA